MIGKMLKNKKNCTQSKQEQPKEAKNQSNVHLVPPDGGFGWIIVAVFAVTHFFDVPILSLFGLICGEKLNRIGITATDITVILNINLAIGFGFGMLNGPLLRHFTYRQISLCGSILLFAGVLLTAVADSMPFYIFSFGIVFALGFATTNSSQLIAICSYFLKRRGRAMSLAVTAAGFGPVLIPLWVSYMMEWYTPEGTLLVLSALVLHSLPASALLHPVSWHMKTVPVTSDSVESAAISDRKRRVTITSLEAECHSFVASEAPLVPHISNSTMSLPALSSTSRPSYRRSVSHQLSPWACKSNSQQSPSIDTQNFEEINLSDSYVTEVPPIKINSLSQSAPVKESKSRLSRIKLQLRSFGLAIVNFFDLTILFEPDYFITMIGLTISFFSEINFTLLLPFILRDLHHFNISQVASLLAVMGATDILSRFIAPYIAEFLNASNKTMYILSIVLMVIIRSFMLIFLDFTAMLILLGAFGIARGLRAVFISLVIPSCVCIERLPSAMGLNMVCNAIIFLVFGPFVGVLRDASGSYIYVVILFNILTMFTVVLWTWRPFLLWTRGYCRISSSDQELGPTHA